MNIDAALDDNNILLRNMIILLNKGNKSKAISLYRYVLNNSKIYVDSYPIREMLISDRDFGFRILSQFNISDDNYKTRYIATIIILTILVAFTNCSILKAIWIVGIIGLLLLALFFRSKL